MSRREAFWREFWFAIVLVVTVAFFLLGVGHVLADSGGPVDGRVRITMRPARDGTQTIYVQEFGKNMLEGGWHRIKVWEGRKRYFRGDVISIAKNAYGEWYIR